MKKILKYLDFLKEKGRKVLEINPGSDEIALSSEDALIAIEFLKESQTPILGGDILSEDNKGELIYAHHLWGPQYVYLIWSCDKLDNETVADYINRSYIIAKENIIEAKNVATLLKKKCYIVIVI